MRGKELQQIAYIPGYWSNLIISDKLLWNPFWVLFHFNKFSFDLDWLFFINRKNIKVILHLKIFCLRLESKVVSVLNLSASLAFSLWVLQDNQQHHLSSFLPLLFENEYIYQAMSCVFLSPAPQGLDTLYSKALKASTIRY